ncbi:MAG: hypothetical protein ISS02_00575 [Candidatus Portnoybacteria bacterium]|nr:hypothetical protein [Candidatus Portnoybacteria bacterium]
MKKIKTIFYSLILIFIAIVIYFIIPFENKIKGTLFPFVITVLGLIFSLLGILLTYYTIKLKIEGKLKWFLILTGIPPVIALVSAILHNLVYGLMIYVFGEGFWGQGGDEVFFFILALIVCPIIFLVGAIGSIIMFKKN